jgi:hypothetical protein
MLNIAFTPMFPWSILILLATVAMLILGYGAMRRARGTAWRMAAIAGLLLALANPVAVEEDRDAKPDIVTVVIDQSASQRVGARPQTTDKILAHIRTTLSQFKNIDLRVIRAGGAREQAGPVDGTRLFRALDQGTADIPTKQMAGTIFITDGQVHDVPGKPVAAEGTAPVHVILTGKRDEFDRRLMIAQVPKYGLVGKEVEIRIRVDDQRRSGGQVAVRVIKDSGEPRIIQVPIGQDHAFTVMLDHAGPNIVQMEIDALPGELSALNNRAVASINGVRERLRVLLVSGEPHVGERVWRNLLKADPSVDLIHFTILRPPEKQDMTPVRELSLIAFPIRELFEVKLNEFDLIIFDRYRRRGVLPSIYIDNIARYVEGGGAILESGGPEYAGPESLYRSPLGRVLPGEPTGLIMTGGLRPRLTSTGERHTVTADLPGAGIGEELPRWGRWFRQIEVTRRHGLTLMNGRGGKPILIVSRVGKGRVAQLMSDQIWLWARGYEGGGPHAELLRRVAHWLMKEPELEENSLQAQLEGNRLAIVRRSVEPDLSPVEITSPSGETRTITLEAGAGGRSRALVPVSETGIYQITDSRHTALAAVGNLNPLEFMDMRTTEARFAALSAATGGGIHWIEDGLPELRRVRTGRLTSGRGWLGLVENRNYTVNSVREIPLLPGLLVLVLALATLLAAWRSEGR